jgi:hypothetical protein
MEYVLGIAVMGLVFGLFWWILRQASRRIVCQFEVLADRFRIDLTVPPAQLAGFNRPEPHVYGDYRGRELSISVPGKGLQNTRQIETRLKVAVDAPEFIFQITGSGLMGRMRQRDVKGLAQWTADVAAFDTALDVRTNDRGRLTRLLDAPRQEKIRAVLQASKGSITCRQGVLEFYQIGLISNTSLRQRFEAMVEFLCDWAEQMEAKA